MDYSRTLLILVPQRSLDDRHQVAVMLCVDPHYDARLYGLNHEPIPSHMGEISHEFNSINYNDNRSLRTLLTRVAHVLSPGNGSCKILKLRNFTTKTYCKC